MTETGAYEDLTENGRYQTVRRWQLSTHSCH